MKTPLASTIASITLLIAPTGESKGSKIPCTTMRRKSPMYSPSWEDADGNRKVLNTMNYDMLPSDFLQRACKETGLDVLTYTDDYNLGFTVRLVPHRDGGYAAEIDRIQTRLVEFVNKHFEQYNREE